MVSCWCTVRGEAIRLARLGRRQPLQTDPGWKYAGLFSGHIIIPGHYSGNHRYQRSILVLHFHDETQVARLSVARIPRSISTGAVQELKSGELILYRAVKMFRFSRDIRYPSLNYRADLQELKSGELILYRAVKMFRFSRDIRYPSLNYRADLQELKSGELILYRAVKMFRFSRDIRYPSLNYRADL